MRLFLLLILTIFITYQAQSEDDSMEISFGNQLVDAANNGDLQSVIHLCKNGYHVDSKGLFGATPLMRAAYNGNVTIAKELLLRGADPTSVDYGGATPIHLASRMGHKEMVELLVEAAPKYFDQADNDGWTPLMRATIAKNNSIVKFLLTKGANPQKQNKWHNDAFTDAVMLLDYNLVKIFVDQGILSKLKPETKNRLINVSKVKKDANIMALLQEPVNMVEKTNDTQPVATIAKTETPTNKTEHKKILGNIFASLDVDKNTEVTKEDIIELPKNEDVVLNQNKSTKATVVSVKKEEKIVAGLPWLSDSTKKEVVELAEVKIKPIELKPETEKTKTVALVEDKKPELVATKPTELKVSKIEVAKSGSKPEIVKVAETKPVELKIVTKSEMVKSAPAIIAKTQTVKIAEIKPTTIVKEKIITGLPWLADSKMVVAKAETPITTKTKIEESASSILVQTKSEPIKVAAISEEAKTIEFLEFLDSEAKTLEVEKPANTNSSKATIVENSTTTAVANPTTTVTTQEKTVTQKPIVIPTNNIVVGNKINDTKPVIETKPVVKPTLEETKPQIKTLPTPKLAAAKKTTEKPSHRKKHLAKSKHAHHAKINYQAKARSKSSAASWLEANASSEPTITDRLSQDPDLKDLRIKLVRPYLAQTKAFYVRVGPLNINDDLAKICAKISNNTGKCSLVKELPRK